MKSEKIFDAMTEIDEEYITEAEDENIKPKKKLSKKAKTAIIAVAAISIFAGFGIAIIPFMGANAGGGTNREPGTNYMSYAGPAFPLSTLEDVSEDIVFERETNFDFSPYTTRTESYEHTITGSGEPTTYTAWDNDAIITDTYIATNIGTEDVTFTATLPTAGAINMPTERLQEVTVDGEYTETEYKIGPYSGGFDPVYGSEKTEGTYNLANLTGWDGYKVLLDNGEYQKAAFGENPNLDIPVKVYSFTPEYLDDIAVIDALDNPDFLISFNYDPKKTSVMYMGFNGGRFSSDEGFAEVTTSVPKSFNPDYGRKVAYIVVFGDDINITEVKCYDYADGDKTPTYAYKINTEIRDMTLEEILLEQIELWHNEAEYGGEYIETLRDTMTDEEYLGYVAEFMYAHAMFAKDPKDRYNNNMLDDILREVGHVSRVIYTTFEVTVPAGESVVIETKTLREASYDFYGKRSKEDLEGFDLVTKVGTNLSFLKQTVSVSNTDYIEIRYNNFGFNLENGITKVILGSEEHYYMEIVRKEE